MNINTYKSIDCSSHQSHNRLSDLVAEHLDHLHYLNDILCLDITDLNQVLTDHLLHKLLIPLYICSLATNRQNTDGQNSAENVNRTPYKTLSEMSGMTMEISNGKVSCVVALFLLSQVFLIISHAPLIQTLAFMILKTDRELFDKGNVNRIWYIKIRKVFYGQIFNSFIQFKHPSSDLKI